MNDVFAHHKDLSTDGLTKFVEALIEAQDYINKQMPGVEKDPNKTKIKERFEESQKEIWQYVDQKIKDYDILPKFAYQLRAQDTDSIGYTTFFLKGRIPDLLFNLIIANQWDPVAKEMKCTQL